MAHAARGEPDEHLARLGLGEIELGEIERRLAAAETEMSHAGEYDYVIINEDFNRAVLDLRSIIRAERLRLSRQLARHGSSINRIT